MTRTVETLVAAARQEAGLAHATSECARRSRPPSSNARRDRTDVEIRLALPPQPVRVSVDAELVERMHPAARRQRRAATAARRSTSRSSGNGSAALVDVVDDGPGVDGRRERPIFEPGARGAAAAAERRRRPRALSRAAARPQRGRRDHGHAERRGRAVRGSAAARALTARLRLPSRRRPFRLRSDDFGQGRPMARGSSRSWPLETSGETRTRASVAMLNKVPEVTLYFWIIKVLCTTVGETAADYLDDNLGPRPDQHDVRHGRAFSSSRSSSSSGVRRYVPGIYWLAVVLISVVGTLITDNLTDNFGVSLVTTTSSSRSSSRSCSRSGTRASGRSRSTRSSRPGARRSTGSRSSSPSPSDRRRRPHGRAAGRRLLEVGAALRRR